MATARERLARSLAVLERLQRDGRRVFRTTELTRVHRERLVANGFLRRVTNGWLISASPAAPPGDSTPWYSVFWEFCARYCERRFGKRWWLSAEQSALLHGGNTAVPAKVVVHAPEGGNNRLELPFGTALFDVRDRREPEPGDVEVRDGLRLLAPENVLIRVSAAFFRTYPVEARIVLSGVRQSSAILVPLLDGGRSVVAGRLAAAFRRIQRPEMADEIVGAMRAAGQVVRETDPFAPGAVMSALPAMNPAAARMRALWARFRGPVLELFPPPPGVPPDPNRVLAEVDEVFRTDAYHSLSIEGYQVTPELIDRARSGKWDPEGAGRGHRDALAAFGYWRAFRRVREAVARVLVGHAASSLARAEHQEWYRELFAPSVTAGITPAHACRVSEPAGLYPGFPARSPAGGRRGGCDGGAVRSARKRARASGSRRTWALGARVHPSVARWKRPDGAFPDESDAVFGGVPVDGDPSGAPSRLHGGAGRGQLWSADRALRAISG